MRTRTRSLCLGVFGLAGYVLGVQGVLYLMSFLTFGGASSAAGDGVLPAWLANLTWMAAFATHHSVAARTAFKRRVFGQLPESVERSAYVGVSGVLLILMIAHWQPLPGTLWDLTGTPFAPAIWTVYTLGWALSLYAVVTLNQFDLFGLLPTWRELRRRPPHVRHLLEKGPYRFVRHPMYVGFTIACWAAPAMDTGRLLFAAAFTAYAIFGAWFEERDLRERYGEAYADYRRRVPACIPRPHRAFGSAL